KFTSSGQIGVIVRESNQEVHDDPESVILEFRVVDTGIGIPPDKLEKIFEAFSQADDSTTRKYGGTGLGLSISRALVEAMNGTIRVESVPGEGSKFIFEVILKRVKPEDQTQNSQYLKKLTRFKGKKVFLIDDNQIALKITNKFCQKMELDVLGMVDSPQAALQKLDELSKAGSNIPDVILCDLMMHGLTGYQILNKLRQNPVYNETKIVAITADLLAIQKQEKESAFFDKVLFKPIFIEELIECFEKLFLKDERQNVKNDLPDGETDGEDQVKILVVEDSKPNQMLMKEYLKRLGYQADFANNGQEAVDIIQNGHLYDICLMDLQMPVMGGVEATRIIKTELSCQMPIVALTAAVLKEDREMAFEVGMDDFLTKPILMDKLKETIIRFTRKS
ncbi:MAG: response regulator, partial [Candidatus Omnitrophica bacterium]|nr:response regulator [Candidatus Omnitrophota bacterium]